MVEAQEQAESFESVPAQITVLQHFAKQKKPTMAVRGQASDLAGLVAKD